MIKTRIVKGPFGPHAGKKEFYYKGKWHFLKWVSKKERMNDTTTKKGN